MTSEAFDNSEISSILVGVEETFDSYKNYSREGINLFQSEEQTIRIKIEYILSNSNVVHIKAKGFNYEFLVYKARHPEDFLIAKALQPGMIIQLKVMSNDSYTAFGVHFMCMG